MDGQLKEAVSLAAEISKQLITLSTGMIVITTTFASTFARNVTGKNRRLLVISWLTFLLAIVMALWHLSALTGNLLRRPIDITLESAATPAFLQMLVFGAATFIFIIFAWRTERSDPASAQPPRDDVLP